MTVSLGGSVTTRGAVSVSPDRLLTFSASLVDAANTARAEGNALTGSFGGAAGAAAAGAASAAGALAAPRYKFRINPDRLNTRHEKLEKYVLTKAGYERQYWGNGLSTFQYAGNTGVFRPDVSAAEYAQRFPGGFDIRETNAWLRFKEFETFYRKNGSTNIFMFYDIYDHEWEGSLAQFSFDRSATKPFHIDYQFTFTGLPIDYPDTKLSTTVSSQNAPATQSRLAGGAGAGSLSGQRGDFPAPSTGNVG